MNTNYNADYSIRVFDCINNIELQSFKRLIEFCEKFNFSEQEARHLISTQKSFMHGKDCYVAFQKNYTGKRADADFIKEFDKAYGKNPLANEWCVYRVSDNPYEEINRQKFLLSPRTISINKGFLYISNNNTLTIKYPFIGLVLQREKNIHGEIEILYKGKSVGTYVAEDCADKKIIIKPETKTSKLEVIATPILEDSEPLKFESMKQAADYFEVFPVTIRNRLQTGKPIEKDHKYFTLQNVGA